MIILLLLATSPINEYRVIQGLYSDGMYELCEKQARTLLQRYPDEKFSPDVSVLLLKSMMKQKKFQEVLEEAGRYLKRYPEKQEDLLKLKGEAEVKLGRYNEAIKTYSRLRTDQRFLYIGDVYFAMGNYKKALSNYQRVKNDFSLISQGWCYYRLKQFNDAYKCFSKVKDKKYIEEAEYMMGKVLLESGNEDGIKTLQNFLKKHPDSRLCGRAIIAMAEFYEKKGDVKNAKRLYLEGLKKPSPYRDLCASRLGIIYFNSGKPDSAMFYLQKVPVSSPYFGESLYYMGLVKSEKGEKLDAISILQQVAEDYPELKGISLFRIGEILKDMGKAEDAVSCFLKIKGKLEDEALIQAGNILLKTNPDSALNLYRRAYSIGGNASEPAGLQIGVALYTLKRYKEAVEHLKTFVNRAKDPVVRARAYLLLGDVSLELKDYTGAEKFYKKALSSKNKDIVPYALEGLGWAYTGQKDYKNAFSILDRLTREYPDFRGKGSLYLILGDVAYAMGDRDRAEKAYKRVKGEKEPEALFRLGTLYLDNGDYKKAVKTFLDLRKRFSVYEKSDMALYMAALALRKSGDLYSSSLQLKALLKLPVSKELKKKATLLLGDNFFDSAEYDSAIHYYEKNLDLYTQPEKGMIPALRGILYSIYRKGGSIDQMAQEYIRRFRGTPLEEEISLLIGDIYISTGEWEKTIKYLEDKKSGRARILLADAYMRKGEEKKAEEIYKTLLNHKTVGKTACRKLLDYLMEKKRFNEALPLTEKLGKEGVKYRVECLIGLKQYRDAFTLSKDIPGCEGALFRGISLIGMGNDEGIIHLDSAITCESTAPRAIYEKSKFLLQKGKIKGLDEILIKVRYLYPESPYYSPCMLLLGKVFLKQGKKAEAQKVLEDVIKRRDGYESQARSILDTIH